MANQGTGLQDIKEEEDNVSDFSGNQGIGDTSVVVRELGVDSGGVAVENEPEIESRLLGLGIQDGHDVVASDRRGGEDGTLGEREEELLLPPLPDVETKAALLYQEESLGNLSSISSSSSETLDYISPVLDTKISEQDETSFDLSQALEIPTNSTTGSSLNRSTSTQNIIVSHGGYGQLPSISSPKSALKRRFSNTLLSQALNQEAMLLSNGATMTTTTTSSSSPQIPHTGEFPLHKTSTRSSGHTSTSSMGTGTRNKSRSNSSVVPMLASSYENSNAGSASPGANNLLSKKQSNGDINVNIYNNNNIANTTEVSDKRFTDLKKLSLGRMGNDSWPNSSDISSPSSSSPLDLANNSTHYDELLYKAQTLLSSTNLNGTGTGTGTGVSTSTSTSNSLRNRSRSNSNLNVITNFFTGGGGGSGGNNTNNNGTSNSSALNSPALPPNTLSSEDASDSRSFNSSEINIPKRVPLLRRASSALLRKRSLRNNGTTVATNSESGGDGDGIHGFAVNSPILADTRVASLDLDAIARLESRNKKNLFINTNDSRPTLSTRESTTSLRSGLSPDPNVNRIPSFSSKVKRVFTRIISSGNINNGSRKDSPIDSRMTSGQNDNTPISSNDSISMNFGLETNSVNEFVEEHNGIRNNNMIPRRSSSVQRKRISRTRKMSSHSDSIASERGNSNGNKTGKSQRDRETDESEDGDTDLDMIITDADMEELSKKKPIITITEKFGANNTTPLQQQSNVWFYKASFDEWQSSTNKKPSNASLRKYINVLIEQQTLEDARFQTLEQKLQQSGWVSSQELGYLRQKRVVINRQWAERISFYQNKLEEE